jgi:hypothetical protein
MKNDEKKLDQPSQAEATEKLLLNQRHQNENSNGLGDKKQTNGNLYTFFIKKKTRN